MKTLTPSQTRYIKAVYELSSGSYDSSARVCDIAERLNVSKASASLAMTKLEKERLVLKDERRKVVLTPEGERHAVSMLDKCTIIEQFLTQILSVNKETAVADACTIEQVVSVDTLCAFCRSIKGASANRRCTKWAATCPGKKCPQYDPDQRALTTEKEAEAWPKMTRDRMELECRANSIGNSDHRAGDYFIS